MAILLAASAYTVQQEKIPLIFSSKKIFERTFLSRLLLAAQAMMSNGAILQFAITSMKSQAKTIDQLVNLTALFTLSSFDNIIYYAFKVILDTNHSKISKASDYLTLKVTKSTIKVSYYFNNILTFVVLTMIISNN